MARLVLDVCDICGDQSAPVETWAIRNGTGAERVIDLCAKHAEPLAEWFDMGHRRETVPTPRKRRGGRQVKVTEMAEIEAMKAAKE